MCAEASDDLVVEYETAGPVVPIRYMGTPAWLATAPIRVLVLDARGVVHEAWEGDGRQVVTVADGAAPPVVDPLTHGPFCALLPDGVEATVELEGFSVGPPYVEVDEATCLTRTARALHRVRGVDPAIHLRWPGGGLEIPADLIEPRVYGGDRVRDGDALGITVRPRASNVASRRRLHDLLRSSPPDTPAVVARADGRVLGVEGDVMQVEGPEGEITTYSLGGRFACVYEGDAVTRGDALTEGSRDHRELFEIWGPERFLAHLHEELREVLGPQLTEGQLAQLARGVVRRLSS